MSSSKSYKWRPDIRQRRIIGALQITADEATAPGTVTFHNFETVALLADVPLADVYATVRRLAAAGYMAPLDETSFAAGELDSALAGTKPRH